MASGGLIMGGVFSVLLAMDLDDSNASLEGDRR